MHVHYLKNSQNRPRAAPSIHVPPVVSPAPCQAPFARARTFTCIEKILSSSQLEKQDSVWQVSSPPQQTQRKLMDSCSFEVDFSRKNYKNWIITEFTKEK
jgi:hypothetical protein